MSYVVDYHIHSYYSDGTMSPVELVKKYKKEEYDIIALTDHDGIGGLKEAFIAGESLEIKVIPGVELSTEYTFADAGGKEITADLHMLGYNFDVENKELLDTLAELKVRRKARNDKLVAALNARGYNIDLAALEAESKGGYVGKLNIARLLVDRGVIEKTADAWTSEEIFAAPEIKKIKKVKLSAQEGVSILKNAGGMPVLAHPAKTRGIGVRGSAEFWENLEIIISSLKKIGLKGVECYHPNHSEEESYKLFKLAEKYHLHVTEGSDFHGKENER